MLEFWSRIWSRTIKYCTGYAKNHFLLKLIKLVFSLYLMFISFYFIFDVLLKKKKIGRKKLLVHLVYSNCYLDYL